MEWGLTPAAVANGGAVFLLALVFLAVVRGALRPDKWVQEQLADKDRQIAAKAQEVEQWREAYMMSEQARDGQGDLIREMLDGLRTQTAILSALRDKAERGPSRG